ncbi:MAG: ABC transporter ATP-binding protein [Lachnospiraceae bacterium]|nr:ABC transporter ATP-binding protein [Lachnospiraceae bacterium]
MTAIKVDHVTKIYKLFDRPIDRLKESLRPGHREYHRKFYALNDISFTVEQGQFVGIIGTNGSGKSTILKIITGVLTPTQGTVTVDGRISALLELGAGFNMEYTGIENIYMNGTMMGYSRQEMDEKLPEILGFADIGDFVHQPVKTYSSGMFVRLAFALAINVDPEVLIVDEALAVGDVFFQAKCYKKINEIRESGATVILVTHDMGTIIKYCDKVVVLNQGSFIAEGEAGKMVDLYKKILAGQFDPGELDGIGQKAGFADQLLSELKERGPADGTQSGRGAGEAQDKGGAACSVLEAAAIGDVCAGRQTDLSKDAAVGALCWLERLGVHKGRLNYGNGAAKIVDAGIFDHKGELTNLLFKGKPFTIKMKVRFSRTVQDPIFAFTIKDSKGTEITGTNSMIEDCETGTAKAGEEVTAVFEQEMNLQGKDYLLSLGCTGFEHGEFVVYDRLYDVVNLTVISEKNTVGYYDMNSRVRLERPGKV